MYRRVNEKLLIQEDYQVLHGAQDLCLDTERPIRFAEFDQSPQYVLRDIQESFIQNIHTVNIPFLSRYSKQAPVALVESQLGTAGHAHWSVGLTLPPYASTPIPANPP